MGGKQPPPLKEGRLCLKEIRVNKNVRKTKVVLQVSLWSSLLPSALGPLRWVSTIPGNKSWLQKRWFVWGSLGTAWWTNCRRRQEPAQLWYTAHQGWGQVAKHLKVCGWVGAESRATWLHGRPLVRKCWKGRGEDHKHPGEKLGLRGPGNPLRVESGAETVDAGCVQGVLLALALALARTLEGESYLCLWLSVTLFSSVCLPGMSSLGYALWEASPP